MVSKYLIQITDYKQLDNIKYLFEDIILSFHRPKNINLNDIQGPLLKKTLFDKK